MTTQPKTILNLCACLAVCTVAILLQSFDLGTALRYERTELFSQVWRLWTAHVMHLSWSHLLMNVLTALIFQWLLLRVWRPIDWLHLLLAGGMLVSVMLYVFQPQLNWYVGLSALLHGLWGIGAVRMLQQDRLIAVILLVLLVGKLIYEQLVGSMPWSSSVAGGHVIVASHAYGAVYGGLFITFELFYKGYNKKYSIK